MKNPLLILMLFISTTLFAQQECAVVCHNGNAVRTFSNNALQGHLKHGDILISQDCDYLETGNECETLSAPKFDFRKPYGFDIPYYVVDIQGRLLQQGYTSKTFQKELPSNQVIFLNVQYFKTTKLYIKNEQRKTFH